MDLIDGREVPPTVITTDRELYDHRGTIEVEGGATVTVRGTVQGTVSLHRGARLLLEGTVQGTLHVSGGAQAVVRGSQQGSVDVDHGGTVIVEPTGKLSGSLHVDGELINRGVRAGAIMGRGTIVDEGSGRVVQPRVVNGINYYDI